MKTLDLDALAAEVAAILPGEAGTLADTLADLAGGSGDAGPKCMSGSTQGQASVGAGELPAGFTPWLVKFRAPNDPDDIGPIEEAYAQMAEVAGLVMSEHRLIPARRGLGISRPDGSIVRTAAGDGTWFRSLGRSKPQPS